MSISKNRRTPVSVGQPKIDFVNGPLYAASYSNNISFAVTQNDIVLTFGEIMEVDLEHAVVERRARITMSASQSKILMYMLAQNLKQYEATFGAIALPPGFEARLEEVATESGI